MATAEPHNREIGLLWQWFGVLGGPIAWTMHLGISYSLVPFVCTTGLVILLHLTTLATALIALAAGIVAFRGWRLTGVGEQTDVGGTLGRSAFMAVAGIFMGGLFFLIILVEGSGNFFLNPCEYRAGKYAEALPAYHLGTPNTPWKAHRSSVVATGEHSGLATRDHALAKIADDGGAAS